MPIRLTPHLALIAALLGFPSPLRAVESPKPVDFDRDVKPIFARHCAACHGAIKQRSGLRLDRRADALAGGDSGKVIAPGKAADSRLIQLVTSDDPDSRMPPKKPLSTAEIATLRAWIEQGAKWPDDGSTKTNAADWWSFRPLAKSQVPAGTNPVDYFIRRKLKEKGLTHSPEADRRTLIRRLYFDLIGLPPSPQEVEAFVNSNDAHAYENLVEQLLASPHHGERWARHWLDVVHFGETHGYDKDKPRLNAWPYRDYVIRAFNQDKPYARFVQEQIAGDKLYPGTTDGLVALGFLAAGPWDFIGHAEVPESKIDGKIARHLDRDDFVCNTIGTFMGLTVGCAQCHNHKFDPISQEDYYRLHAVFAAIDRTDRRYDADPKVAAHRAELEAGKKAASTRLAQLEAEARKKVGPELAAIDQQLAGAAKPSLATRPPEYGYHSQISAKPETMKWVQVDLGESMKLDRIVLKPCRDDFAGIGAGFGFPVRFRIELSDDVDFQSRVVIADETTTDFPKPGMAPYHANVGGKSGRYIRVSATRLALRQNDYILALAELEAFDSGGKNRARGKRVTALDSIEAPVRWRKSNLTDGLAPAGPKLAATEVAKLTSRRESLLKTALGEKRAAEVVALRAKIVATDAALVKLNRSRQAVYIGAVHTGSGTFVGTGSQGGKPRPIFVLSRGDVTRPGKEVGPGAISGIPGLDADFHLPPNHTEADRRAALAKWITDPNNPLTWRVMANRVWQYHFGRGIADTPNDFGKMGEPPTHPELLDFLARELANPNRNAGGGSLKHLHRLIVMSATYKQSSASLPEAAKIDGDNRYLWRQNRRKLEAEAVRDAILSAAGKLDLTMGGPSFQDFVIEHPEHSPHYQYHLHNPDEPKSHRRAIYRFVVRSKQQPFMVALDCADPSLAVDRRNQTQTPQQALALLNNKLTLAMAKHFAERVEKLGHTNAERVSIAVRIALGRDPTISERDALAAYAKKFGLASTCRVILNLNEFVFVD